MLKVMHFFEKAYMLGEDYHVNYVNEAASFLLNPTIIEYKGEDFEILMVHYYKALNFLKWAIKRLLWLSANGWILN
jgi:hypothetical protein